MIFGKADEILPTFRSNGIEEREYGGQRLQMRVYRGDVANRGKGTLLVKMK